MDNIPSLNEPTILIINQDKQAARKAIELLEKNRMKWRYTAFAQRAIEIIKKDRSISIVIAYSDMSYNSGIELARHLQRCLLNDRIIEILLISAHQDQDDAVTASQVGISSLLIEPVTEEQFVNSVTMAIRVVHNRERSQVDQVNLIKASDVAQKTIEQQNDIVSMVCHEFRTPLAVIDAAAQRLLKHHDTCTEDEIRRRADRIRSAVLRLTNMIDTNLAAAKIDVAADQLESDVCNLARILDTVVINQRSISPDQDIHCDFTNLPHEIKGNEALLEILFSNLLSNAVKYSPDRKQIDVLGKTVNGTAVIEVIDHGIGIENSECERIFEKFYRAGSAKGIPGTGIGLNLCQQLAKLHGGHITVNSIHGKGTTFTIHLPTNDVSGLLASDQGTPSDYSTEGRLAG